MTSPATDLPQIEVRYTDLSLTVRVTAASASRTMPTVFETLSGAATALPRALVGALSQAPPPPMREVKVLDGASGVIRPGTMTLLLGHPGAGKSTFLKALCGRLSGTAQKQLQGSVQYSGLAPPALAAAGLCLGQLVQYVSQLDEHFPFLTVRESLAFVARNAIAGADEAAVNARVEEISELLHLKGCADTIIGDDLARGVSGGEKKRVTVGEGLITAARMLALDEVSTGLDSSVTFDVMKSLRARAQRQGLAVVVALLQPTPGTVAQFDDIILLREGAVVFHGAREELPGYLRGLGYLLPAAAGASATASAATGAEEGSGAGEEDLADWLSELLTFPQRRHAKDVAREAAAASSGTVGLSLSGSSGDLTGAPTADTATSPTPATTQRTPPLTTAAMVEAWLASPLRAHNLRSQGATPPPTLTTPAARAQYGVPYVHSAWAHASSVLSRQVRLLSANSLFVFIRIFSAFFMAVVFGGLYWQGGVSGAGAQGALADWCWL
jgi:ABC-type multidrug transport system ATPase subunit